MATYQEYQQRPRSRTVLSFGSGSNKSGEYASSGAPKIQIPKEELYETSKEKAAKRISTKANPNIAVNEAEPVAQALMQPTMDSNLRGMQHRDMYGNLITDPDRSNPTRPRLERPLDTIRSFEAAIDGKYGRVSSYSETPGPSRPASSYFGYNGSPGYGNRSGRPDSYVDSSMYGSANRRSPAPFGGPPRRGFGPGNRNNSDPMLYGNGTFPQPRREQYQPSYDTTSSGGSGGTDNWNPSTDPSSPNSSVDRIQAQPPPPPKHDLGEQYGFIGFGAAPQTDFDYGQQNPQQQQYTQQQQQPYQQQQSFQPQPQQQQSSPRQTAYQNQYQIQIPHNPYQREEGAPPPPPHKGYMQRTTSAQQPRALQKSPSYGQQYQAPKPAPVEKRKSWLMRTFSKSK